MGADGGLALAESRFGVDRLVIAGVWGVESNFGKDIGKRSLVQSLATLSCTAAAGATISAASCSRR